MPQTLSQAHAQRFIQHRYGDRVGELTLVGAGEWSTAYAFTLDGRELVARFGAYGEDFVKDRAMARHSSDELPIPAVVELGEAPGGFFIIAQRVRGQFLDDLDEVGMRAVLPALLAALDTVRDIDIADTTGFGGWSPDGVAPHRSWAESLLSITQERSGRLHGWRDALEGSPTGSAPFDAGVEVLRSLAPRLPERRQLIHQDLLNRNVLVSGARLSAVLDWGNSLYGDGLYDLAWLLFWWPWYPAWSGIDIHAIIAAHLKSRSHEVAEVELRLRCYQIHIGLDSQSYNAFTGRWANLAAVAEQTTALL
jgi:hygromycin-B 4-O-kinase